VPTDCANWRNESADISLPTIPLTPLLPKRNLPLTNQAL